MEKSVVLCHWAPPPATASVASHMPPGGLPRRSTARLHRDVDGFGNLAQAAMALFLCATYSHHLHAACEFFPSIPGTAIQPREQTADSPAVCAPGARPTAAVPGHPTPHSWLSKTYAGDPCVIFRAWGHLCRRDGFHVSTAAGDSSVALA